jgi:hypothetical protein
VDLVVTAAQSVGNSWTKVTGTLTTTWTGSLLEASWRAFTYPDGGTSDFYIDDARMWRQQPTGLIPGTWRREALP